MLESTIENYLKRYVEKLGGLCWKFVSPGTDGVPDRIVLLNGRVIFVELKAPGEKPRPLQLKRHAQLRALGFEVVILDSIPAVDHFIGELIAHCNTRRTSTRTIFPS
ncbi:VRR-NUC domain-containing protein [Anaeroselena agilis]|uniref:VRR-NUC domain-containing protein n=1 Tax=Anaeroselena agilis TaxID=3063788 RepID=A0ABU3NTB2_9FIRM|nr:VRR-NUC domain-containing protein [Selenomonadales bacterium 4137-cl]